MQEAGLAPGAWVTWCALQVGLGSQGNLPPSPLNQD